MSISGPDPQFRNPEDRTEIQFRETIEGNLSSSNLFDLTNSSSERPLTLLEQRAWSAFISELALPEDSTKSMTKLLQSAIRPELNSAALLSCIGPELHNVMPISREALNTSIQQMHQAGVARSYLTNGRPIESWQDTLDHRYPLINSITLNGAQIHIRLYYGFNNNHGFKRATPFESLLSLYEPMNDLLRTYLACDNLRGYIVSVVPGDEGIHTRLPRNLQVELFRAIGHIFRCLKDNSPSSMP